MYRFNVILVFCCSLILLINERALALDPNAAMQVGIVENLGLVISPDLIFTDETGLKKKISEYFDGTKPIIIAPVYYGCPNLCTLVLNGLVDGLQKLSWDVGEKFRVVAVSIDPSEDSKLAAAKKEAYLEKYQSGKKSWSFLTGDKENIERLVKEIGFGYVYDDSTKQFIHAAGIYVVTPDGKISRVLYGSKYPASDLKLSLIEAGAPVNFIDKTYGYLHDYDNLEKRYRYNKMHLATVMRFVGFFVVLYFTVRLFTRRWVKK